MYHVYIIQSAVTNRYYVGVTSDMDQRLRHHNSGANRSTKNGKPWALIHTESFSSSSEAWKREKQIKKYKGGEPFKKLVSKDS